MIPRGQTCLILCRRCRQGTGIGNPSLRNRLNVKRGVDSGLDFLAKMSMESSSRRRVEASARAGCKIHGASRLIHPCQTRVRSRRNPSFMRGKRIMWFDKRHPKTCGR